MRKIRRWIAKKSACVGTVGVKDQRKKTNKMNFAW
jgi:hypothetical protein